MFQDHALFPHLTVADNIGFGLEMKGIPAAARSARVGELLDLVGLSAFGGRAVAELSGGEAQRVALARALAPEPSLLMLDEPFGSLDRVLRDQLTGEVRRLLTELGQTALHVTHDQTEAFALADRVAVLAEGRLEQVGSPEELWYRPVSSFVAEFLGQPNRWTIEVGPAGAVDLVGLVGLLGALGTVEPGRYEVLVPVPAVSVDPAGAVPAVVDSVRFVEGRYEASGTIDGDPALGSVVFECAHRLDQGERVHLAVDVDRIHVIAPA